VSRPYGEQHATAAALHGAQLATVCDGWPVARDWPAVLEAAAARGGAAWPHWTSGRGARHAADLLEELLLRTVDRAEPLCASR
jgi:hypothetical protein